MKGRKKSCLHGNIWECIQKYTADDANQTLLEEKGTFIDGATKSPSCWHAQQECSWDFTDKSKATSLWPPPLSSYSICSFPLLSLSGRPISSLNVMERRIDSYGTGVYAVLVDVTHGGRALLSIWWISDRAQNCQPKWISWQPRGRAGLRNKPLYSALCHVFTTLLVSRFPLQNQPLSRLLTKTILYLSTLYIHTEVSPSLYSFVS